jgi:hypothetical protein
MPAVAQGNTPGPAAASGESTAEGLLPYPGCSGHLCFGYRRISSRRTCG